jgi:hypothetical protein
MEVERMVEMYELMVQDGLTHNALGWIDSVRWFKGEISRLENAWYWASPAQGAFVTCLRCASVKNAKFISANGDEGDER